MAARNPCAFLEPLIKARPAYADAVRLELKEFTYQPEFVTFVEYTIDDETVRNWFVQQLENAPGGPPGWVLD